METTRDTDRLRKLDKLLLTAEDVAELLSVCVKTITRKLERGKFPAPVVATADGIRRWRLKDVEIWVERLPTRKRGTGRRPSEAAGMAAAAARRNRNNGPTTNPTEEAT